MKILIIQQKRIGDVLISTILCNNLKKKYPESTIDYMCHFDCVDVLTGNPNINSIIVLENKVRKSYFLLFNFFLKIRSNKYDVLIDAYNRLETNLITIFSGADYKISYYKWYSSFFYTHNIKRFDNTAQTKYGFAIDDKLLLLKPLDIDSDSINPFPKLYVSKDECNEAIALLDKHKVSKDRKIVMISLLGSEKQKTYPLEHMAKVVEFVAENKDVTILFNYFPNQMEDAQKIFNLCSKSTQKKIHFDLLGNNLRSFIGIMNQCDVIIGNDGGAINIAKALNKPSFIIFSAHVRKNDWSTFEDGVRNISVHLNDFKSELIGKNLSHKEIENNSAQLYQQFSPELFKDKIKFFMEQNL